VPVVRVLVPGLASPYGESSRTPTLRLLESVI
jgi:ribosomal protein S12 methylthiotransferase accessory factor